MRTVVVAVSYRAIVIDEGRRALARPEAVTNAVGFAERAILSVTGKGTRHAGHIHLVFIVISMVITGLAAVLADLFIGVLVDVTEVAGTADITTVRPIITVSYTHLTLPTKA